jgi:hypothetical protein
MNQPFQNGLMPPAMTNVNGIVPVMNLAALERSERQNAESENNRQEITNLAGHVRKCWSEAQQAKLTVEQRLLQAMRQRRGEYDPDLLSAIRQQGGSEVYMMLTSNKCRAAKAWLTDTLLGNGADKPWTLAPTKLPDLSPKDSQAIIQTSTEEALALEQSTGVQVGPGDMETIMGKVQARVKQARFKKAKALVRDMEDKMEDQLSEGNFIFAFTQFIDDLVTFPAAILKGPVIRKKPQMKWVQKGGEYTLEVEDAIVKEWERVDPFMLYPSPNSTGVNDGYLIERHRLSRAELEAYRDVEGYSTPAINAVLDEYGQRGLHDWLMIDTQKAHVEEKLSPTIHSNPEGLIDALQFWGSIQGKQLREWGMSAEDVPEELKEYDCEIWLIGNWVIKATLNFDPFKRKPYFKTSYEEIPGTFWGNGIPDLIRDCSAVCNAAARALVNNMGIASGPQVDVNVDRLPKGETITKMYPWKLWQTKSDPHGNTTTPAINFFQPDLNAPQLMAIYEKFSVMADEYSSIPRYLTGDSGAGGAGRTASGLSMLMSNAGKGIKQVISNIDQYVIGPAIERLYFHNMKYETDNTLKGDVRVVARGANSLVVKEQAMLRRNEFLQIVLNSDRVAQVVGNEGLAALLREGVKSLDMDSDEIVPSADMLKAQENMMMQAQMQQQGMPQPGGGATLQDGAPVTNNFRPMGAPA